MQFSLHPFLHLWILLLVANLPARAQPALEYVANGGFEKTLTGAHDYCDPVFFAQNFTGFWNFLIPDWSTRSHPKLLHRCFTGLTASNSFSTPYPYNHSAPDSDYGNQEPHSGDGMALLRLFWQIPPFVSQSGNGVAEFPTDNHFQFQGNRAVLMAPLIQSLDAGWTYQYEFFLNVPERTSYLAPFGIYFPKSDWTGFGPEVDINPVNGDGDPIYGRLQSVPAAVDWFPAQTDRDHWKKFSGQFVAGGGEKFLMLGSFQEKYLMGTELIPTGEVPANPYESGRAHYFIDDVSLRCVNIPQVEFEFPTEIHSCLDELSLENVNWKFVKNARMKIFAIDQSGGESLILQHDFSGLPPQHLDIRNLLTNAGLELPSQMKIVLEVKNHCFNDWYSFERTVQVKKDFYPITQLNTFEPPYGHVLEAAVQLPFGASAEWRVFNAAGDLVFTSHETQMHWTPSEMAAFDIQLHVNYGRYCHFDRTFHVQVRDLRPGEVQTRYPNPYVPEFHSDWAPIGAGFQYQIRLLDLKGRLVADLPVNDPLNADLWNLSGASYIAQVRLLNQSGQQIGLDRLLLQVIR